MRLGVLGGTFDPVHFGHLLLAECCREQCQLDEVWFLPAYVPPHKGNQVTPATQRVEMLELAIGGHEAFHVSRREIDRGGVSYTAETLSELAQEDPARELYFLMGADSLVDLPNWRDPERICQLATLVVVCRAGVALPAMPQIGHLNAASTADPIRLARVDMPVIEISSRDIRSRVASGRSIRYRTPAAVAKYIETARLYLPLVEAR